MKALFVKEPGPTPEFEIREVETPEADPNDVVIEVQATGVCGHDIAIMTGLLRRGVDHNVILGHEISGSIAQVGSDVTGLSEGEPVVASLTASCGRCDRCDSGLDYRCRYGTGVGHGVNGGFAEYVKLPANSVSALPSNMDLTCACLIACPIGVCVRAAKSVARVSAGESVLVTGAGGGLGVHAVQVASALGAAQVFAATSSPEKLDVLDAYAPGARSLVESSTSRSWYWPLRRTRAPTSSSILSAQQRSGARYAACPSMGAWYCWAKWRAAEHRSTSPTSWFRDAAIFGSTGACRPDIEAAIEMVASGSVQPVVHATMPLEDAAEAVSLVTSRQATGRVVLTPR